MILIFRPFRLGILTIYPNLIPILYVLGICGIINIRMDVISALFAAIAIGMVVDDTIHFVNRFRNMFNQTGDHRKAVILSLQSSGKAISITSVTLVLSFCVYLFSDFLVISQFGILLISTVVFALLADLIVMPTLFVLFKPLKNRKKC